MKGKGGAENAMEHLSDFVGSSNESNPTVASQTYLGISLSPISQLMVYDDP